MYDEHHGTISLEKSRITTSLKWLNPTKFKDAPFFFLNCGLVAWNTELAGKKTDLWVGRLRFLHLEFGGGLKLICNIRKSVGDSYQGLITINCQLTIGCFLHNCGYALYSYSIYSDWLFVTRAFILSIVNNFTSGLPQNVNIICEHNQHWNKTVSQK